MTDSLADPATYPNLFPDHEQTLEAEIYIKKLAQLPKRASSYKAPVIPRDILSELNEVPRESKSLFSEWAVDRFRC